MSLSKLNFPALLVQHFVHLTHKYVNEMYERIAAASTVNNANARYG